jgi:hypothetical protein
VKAGEFSFLSADSILRSRKDAPWPANVKEARELWKKHLEEELPSPGWKRPWRPACRRVRARSDHVQNDRGRACYRRLAQLTDRPGGERLWKPR